MLRDSAAWHAACTVMPVLAATANSVLLENATELRALFEAAPDAIVITDDDGLLVDANPAALALLARPRREILARPLAEFVDASSDFAAHWHAFLRAGWAHMELRIVRPGGETRIAECSSRASFVPGRHFSFVRDVTERRRLEEQVRHAQKMEAIGRLVGGIAHDFNNLLTAVLIYAGLLGGELGDDPRRLRYVEQIRGAGERGSALVAQLLALGRKEVLDPCVLSLGEAVESMRDLLQLSLGEDIELEVERLAAPDTVRVDPTQLHQVVLNLALNARDAMAGGGRLVIECRARTVASGDVEAPAGRYIVLQVRDSGCGMEPAIRARIFEPFFTTKPRGKGTGLGLSMVYGIVRQSGGAVQVESAPGAGTTVSVYLPAVNEEEERTAAAAGAPLVAAHPATILLVEDEELVRRSLEAALDSAGYRVLAAADAPAAVAMVREEDFDLVVSDLVLPGGSGREVAEEVRRRHPSTRVLLISGYDDEAHNRRERAPWEFLKKPFPPQRLVEKVATLLQRRAR